MLRSVLDAEGQIWKEKLRWDYRASARLLMQYLDNHMLPGFAAVVAEQVIGYVFCVYEETKAVIGDVFAIDQAQHGEQAHKLEDLLLKHLLELLVNSPQVDRIESQLLLTPQDLILEYFMRQASRFSSGCLWSNILRACRARHNRTYPASLNCVRGAMRTLPRQRGSYATHIAITLTASSTTSTDPCTDPCAF